MTQSILDMAKELVVEAIKGQELSPDQARHLLGKTHAALLRLHQVETGEVATSPGATGEAEAASVDWKQSIKPHAVYCLVCGETFRQLSARHLSKHDLNPRSYRHKYGIPRTQSLSAREVTARRRELAKGIQPWIQAKETRSGAKQVAAKKASGKRAAAKA